MHGLGKFLVTHEEPLSIGFGVVLCAGLFSMGGRPGLVIYGLVALGAIVIFPVVYRLLTHLATARDNDPLLTGLAVVLPGFVTYGELWLLGVPHVIAICLGTMASAVMLYAFPLTPVDAAPQETQRVSGAYGDAGWATQAEVETHNPAIVLRSTAEAARAVVLGNYANPYRLHPDGSWPMTVPLSYAGTNNIVTIGSSGSGKGTRAIIPTLLTNRQSMFVLDVKGTNCAVTAQLRAGQFGHRVCVLDPFEIAKGMKLKVRRARYNPLAELADVDPCGAPFQKRIAGLCTAAIRVEGNDPHWPKGARDITRCVMGDVASNRETIKAGNNTLPVVHALLSMPRAEFSAYMKEVSEKSPVPWVRRLANSFSGDSKEIAGFISSALRQLDFLDHPGVAAFLSGSDFTFADLRRKPMTIYCVFGIEELDTYANFGRLIVQSLFNDLVVPPTPDAQLPVLVVLDEQAKLGKMEILETAVAVVREYGVRVWSVFQNLTQIRSIYGEAWETFLSNAGVVQILGINDQTTAEYCSKRIGNTTVRGLSQGESWGVNQPVSPWMHNQGSSNSGGSQGVTEAAVPFLRPEQLFGMTGDFAFAFVIDLRYPVPCIATPYYEQQLLALLADPNPFRSAQGV